MKYQDCIAPAQAPDGMAGECAAGGRLPGANINPNCPECVDEFLAWRPLSYREHFAASHFKGRDLAIAAYEAADPALRQCLDTLTAMLQATGAALRSGLPPDAGGLIAEATAAWLKPVLARAGMLINGEDDDTRALTSAPQAVVDGLMQPDA